MPKDVAIGIKEANFRRAASADAFLASCFLQQGIGCEHRGHAVRLVPQDGRNCHYRFGSFIATATTIPETSVSVPTTPIATGMPNWSARPPAMTAPIA
jgi:hypothetical protein